MKCTFLLVQNGGNDMLTIEELKAAHNNVMTVMENHILSFVECDRQVANMIANEVLELDRESEILLSDDELI